jgi:hypothetical protein
MTYYSWTHMDLEEEWQYGQRQFCHVVACGEAAEID